MLKSIKLLTFLICSLIITSCNDDSPTSENNNTKANENFLNLPSGVSWDDITSVFLAQKNKTNFDSYVHESHGISFDFYNGTGAACDAGLVLLNNDTLNKVSAYDSINNKTVYTYSKYSNVLNNTNYAINAFGNSNYPSFTGNVTSPVSDIDFSNLSQNSAFSKSSDSTITWTGTYETSAQIRIVIYSSNNSIDILTEDDGTYTFNSSILSSLSNGQGSISIYRIKYNLVNLSNSKKSILACINTRGIDINISN